MGNPNGNPISKRYSITLRQEKMSKIFQYHFVKKWNAREIAQALDMPQPTVRAYIQVIKRNRLRQVTQNEPDFYNLNEWIAKTVENFDEIVKHAWNEYAKSVTPKERMNCLDRVHAAEKEKFDILQSMGVAPKAKEHERINEKITYISKLRGEPDKLVAAQVQTEKVTTHSKPEMTKDISL